MNIIKVLFIVLFILSTIVTFKIQPDLHNPMIIENQDFVLSRISDNLESIPTMNVETVNTAVNEPQTVQNVQTVEVPVQYTEQPVQQKVINLTPQESKTTQKNQK